MIAFQHHTTNRPRKGDESDRSARTKKGQSAIAEVTEEQKEAHVEQRKRSAKTKLLVGLWTLM